MIRFSVLVDTVACRDRTDGGEPGGQESAFTPFGALDAFSGRVVGVAVVFLGRLGVVAADGAAGAELGFSAPGGGGCGRVALGGGRVVAVTADEAI